MGRLYYNQVIQETSKIQTFANIIRVKYQEPTAFLDVTQINAAVLAQATLAGTLTALGTHPQNTGSASLGLEYQESPTVTYQPVSGQALVSQISTPLTIDSLANLFSSDWPFASLLTMAVDRLTPGYKDYAAAINALIALDHFGAIIITAEYNPSNQSSPTPPRSMPASPGSKPAVSEQAPNVLIVTLQPKHPYTSDTELSGDKTQEMIQKLWCRLNTLLSDKTINCESPAVREKLPTRILFSRRTSASGKVRVLTNTTTVAEYPIFTRSSLGILKFALEIQGNNAIGFLPEKDFQEITNYPWNSRRARKVCFNMRFYTLLPSMDEDYFGLTPVIKNIGDRFQRGAPNTPEQCLYTTSTDLNGNDITSVLREDALFGLRRYIIVIVSDAEIPNSYVSLPYGTKWYSISNEDEVSKQNFALISQFLTMQAVAPAPPPSSVIPVGASR
jgi:hypothetical protein